MALCFSRFLLVSPSIITLHRPATHSHSVSHKPASRAPISSQSSMENPPQGYRTNVGICLINPSSKKIFAASRLDIPDAWQMPQGGIDGNEDPRTAAMRELREETGVTSAEIIAEVPYWLTYDFPPAVREKLNVRWGSDWKGQAQKQSILLAEMAVSLQSGSESAAVFVAPEINSFGQSFRDYAAESARQEIVEEFYRLSHINQTYDYAKKMRDAYKKLDKTEMSIWECCVLLNDVVDDSDPDLDEPQIEHLLQTAEAIRKDYPDEDWLHLTGLIHDLGKVLLLPSFGGLPQWSVGGDTFPLGCAFDEVIVHHEYFKDNPDHKNPLHSTQNGVYTEGCGLENVVMSWGHDEYMYLVAKENKTTLPYAGLFIIRFHSFYALHKGGAYKHLMNEEDVENLKWLNIFNKYDLYSKSKVRINVEEVKPYYLSLINKYFPQKLKW